MNILLIAEDSAGIRMLHALRQSNHRIVGVVSSPSRHTARANVLNLAAQLGYATWSSHLVKDRNFAQTICDHEVDIIINVYSLFVVCKEILGAPLLGSYNLHPGPLPRYAGLNSVCWAIYRGEKMHGVSLHRMELGVDTGSIVSREIFEIGAEETGLSLSAKCVAIGVPMVMRFLEAAERKPPAILEVPQDLTKREYFGREVPENGNLSWHRSARQIYDFVRSCDFGPFDSPWGHPRTAAAGSELGIMRARLTGKPVEAPPGTVGLVNDSGAEVACADEWILLQHVLKDGKRFPAATILETGDQLEDQATGS
jgi:methionyl-tRNA formyltransferase